MKDSQKNTPELSIVIPLYNEEMVFPELLHRIRTALNSWKPSYEILFVDDASTDTTRAQIRKEIANDPRIKAIFFSRNFGHQAAVTAGLEHSKGAVVAVMDGDLQDPPEVIRRMYESFADGYEVAYGVRQKRKEGFIKRSCYFLFYRLLTLHKERYAIPKDAGDFCLMSRRVVDTINMMPEHRRYVRGIRAWVGFKQTGVTYERDKRYAGVSKYSAIKLFQLAYDGFFSFTNLPLLLVNTLGFLFSAVAFAGILSILGIRLFTNLYIPGFASTAIIILFIGGIQLLMLGIVGEYVKRMYDEVKRRPIYITDELLNIDENRSV